LATAAQFLATMALLLLAVKQKTLSRELQMVNAPDQRVSCFSANDVHGDWFRTCSPAKQFLSVTIEPWFVP
jgi:hypothetical protein